MSYNRHNTTTNADCVGQRRIPMITIEQEHANKRADLVKFRLALRECRDNAVVARAGIVQLSSKLAPYFSGADQELSLILRHVESILDTIDLASS